MAQNFYKPFRATLRSTAARENFKVSMQGANWFRVAFMPPTMESLQLSVGDSAEFHDYRRGEGYHSGEFEMENSFGEVYVTFPAQPAGSASVVLLYGYVPPGAKFFQAFGDEFYPPDPIQPMTGQNSPIVLAPPGTLFTQDTWDASATGAPLAALTTLHTFAPGKFFKIFHVTLHGHIIPAPLTSGFVNIRVRDTASGRVLIFASERFNSTQLPALSLDGVHVNWTWRPAAPYEGFASPTGTCAIEVTASGVTIPTGSVSSSGFFTAQP